MSTQNRRQVSAKTHKMLWGGAASCCAFPDCRRELVIIGNAVDDASLVGQECHIIAKEPEGPRGHSDLSSKKRDEYENLILLCNIHHKVIDDQPNTYTVEFLRHMKDAHEQWVRESLQGTSPLYWHVPDHNPLFTGREDLLNLLHDRLITTKSTALTQPQAIHGLGGVGKTQIAIEYTYIYRENYRAIFWVRAATRETLTLDFVEIAQELHLPLQDEQDQSLIIEAVKTWFTMQTNWLLVFDNADDVSMVHDFLPSRRTGHIILTTRDNASGEIAQGIEVDMISKDEGVLLLLRCAKILSPEASLTLATDEQRKEAEMLVEELGKLPLALAQAGAYIEETKSSISKYLKYYRTRRKELLQRRGKHIFNHPESVATTWSLSFTVVEQANVAAADILRLCAFLDSDAIPEAIFLQKNLALTSALQSLVGDGFLLDQAIEELLRFSLVRRSTGTEQISLHRLVQAVIKDEMDSDTYRQWAERAIQVIEKAFPVVDVSTWEQCRRYLPHAQACISLILQEGYTFAEARDLLVGVARYEYDHALYSQAELLYQRALTICEQVLGPEHPNTATSLNNLALLYDAQGKYEQAEPLYQRALAICEQVLGPEHPNTATSLNNLALLYDAQGKYEQAEPLYQRALAIREQVLGPEHPDTASSLNNLAYLYKAQGKYEQAEPLYQRALAICEQVLGPEHPNTASSLNNLAYLYKAQGKYEQAEPLYQRALAIYEQVLGPEHPNTRIIRNNYLLFLKSRG